MSQESHEEAKQRVSNYRALCPLRSLLLKSVLATNASSWEHGSSLSLPRSLSLCLKHFSGSKCDRAAPANPPPPFPPSPLVARWNTKTPARVYLLLPQSQVSFQGARWPTMYVCSGLLAGILEVYIPP